MYPARSQLDMTSIVCGLITEAKAVAWYVPDVVLAEPTDLIPERPVRVADDAYTMKQSIRYENAVLMYW